MKALCFFVGSAKGLFVMAQEVNGERRPLKLIKILFFVLLPFFLSLVWPEDCCQSSPQLLGNFVMNLKRSWLEEPLSESNLEFHLSGTKAFCEFYKNDTRHGVVSFCSRHINVQQDFVLWRFTGFGDGLDFQLY